MRPARGTRSVRAACEDYGGFFADRLTGQGLSASTVQNTLNPLRRIFDRAIRRDLVAVDPTERLEFRRPRDRDGIAPPDEVVRLLAALGDFERALWATAMCAGLRRGELRALRWGDRRPRRRVAGLSRRRRWSR